VRLVLADLAERIIQALADHAELKLQCRACWTRTAKADETTSPSLQPRNSLPLGNPRVAFPSEKHRNDCRVGAQSTGADSTP
jgi:hypothetical protein